MFAPCFRFLREGRLVAVMDPDPAAAQAVFRQVPGAVPCDRSEDVLEHPEVDAVIVASPVSFHREQVLAAARAGKHVLCEKPMAGTVDECDAMLDACRSAGVTLMVGLVKRFDRSMAAIKRMVEAGELGSVFQVTCEWSWPQYFLAGWRGPLEAGGGLFLDHGSHAVDLCRWWLGEIETVSGEIAVLLRGREVEDQALALYRHAGGAVSLQQHSRMTHKPLIERYQIDGSLGTLVAEYPGWSGPGREPYTMTRYREGRVDRAIVETLTLAKEPVPDDSFDRHDAYLAELRHFCRAIRGEEPLRVTGLDGRSAIEAITAAYLSSWKKEKVSLPLAATGPLDHAFRAARRHIAGARD